MSDRMRHRSRICRFPLALTHLLFLLVLAQYCRAEVKITGVPDYQQGDFAGTNDCAPVASADILGYWDANGLPNLIDGSNDFATNPTGVTDLVNALKTNMRWTSSGTQIAWIWAGIADTAYQRGYSFSTANDGSVVWSDITTQIDAGRPAVFTMYHSSYGGMHSVGCMGYDGDGGNQVVIVHDNWYPAGDVYLNFNEISERTLTTVVPPALASYTLTIQSSPITGVAITISPADNSSQSNGTTNFTRSYNSGTSVTLTAPATAANGLVDYTFVRWTLDGANQTAGQTSLQATMSAAHTAVAVYQIVTRTLTVQSSPITGVAITGDTPGTTNYAATCDDEEIVSLTAPADASFASEDYVFVRWILDSVNQTAGETTLSALMNTDRTAVAVYSLAPPSTIDDLAALLVETAASAKIAARDAAASTNLYGVYVAANAADDDPNTFWSSTPSSQPRAETLTLDLDSVQPVAGIRLLPRAAWPGLFPTAFTVFVSTNGTDWVQAASVSGLAPAAGSWCEREFHAQDARYLRLSIPAGRLNPIDNHYYVQMAECEVYGPAAQAVELSWTAPGSTGLEGVAASYDVRWFASAIVSDEEWAAATQLDDEPAPLGMGIGQSMTVGLADLPQEATVYFAMRSTNDGGGISELSNSPSLTTPGVPPAAVADLAVSGTDASSLTVEFSAVGDDGQVGQAAAYDLRYSTAPITDANWAAATVFDATPAPKAAGGSETITITGLAHSTTYYVAVKVQDEAGNESELSNVATGATTDVTAPATVDDLAAALVEEDGQVKLDAVSAVGSTSLYGVYVGAYAIDGDPATLWSSAPAGAPRAEALIVDLGSMSNVGKVRILPRPNWLSLFPSTFFIDVSIDGANWTEAAAENAYSAQAGVWWEGTFDAAAARWVRLRVPESRLNTKDGAYYVQLAELEVYAGPQQAVQLTWTAPGDDGALGTAASYDVRRSLQPIVDADSWNAATPAAGAPAPSAAGEAESMTTMLHELPADSRVYFAVRTTDDAANESELSNSPHVDIPADDTPPGAILDLEAEIGASPAELDVASAVNSTALYGVYTAANLIDGDTNTLWSSSPAPAPRAEQITLDLGTIRAVCGVRLVPRSGWSQLFPDAFAIQTSADGSSWVEALNESGYEAADGVAYAGEFQACSARYVRLAMPASRLNTRDGAYYLQLTEFAVLSPYPNEAVLTWSATGADSYTGTAAGYEVRRAAAPIDSEAAWDAAAALDDVPDAVESGGGMSMAASLADLPPGSAAYFAARATDASGNRSALSNAASVNMPADCAPPSAIADLAASLLSADGAALPVATASSSTNLYGVYVAANAADGDEATLWSSSGSVTPRAEWLMLDLGDRQVVGKVRLLPRPNWPQLFPASFAVEVSTDGQAWTEAVAETGFSAQPNVWYEAEFAPCNARYVRLSVPASRLNDKNGLYYVQLMEFQACEPASQVVRLTWSAPGDDTAPGRAGSYSVRYAASAIASEAAWAAATPVAVGMTPGAAGSEESLVTDLLPVDGPMYFAVRSADAAANVSGLSNAAAADPPADETSPAAIADLAAAAVNAGPYPKLSAAEASSSSDLYGVYVAANAVDGDEQTLWSSQPSQVPREEYLTADLGSVQTVCRVRLLPRPAWPQLFPDDFALEVSADGAAWSEAAAETGYCAQAGSWYEAVFAAVETRFVRLSIPNSRLNARDGHYYIQLMEFEVYGQPEQAVELTWTAPGDDGCVGTGAGYEVRYAVADISDEAGWEAASELTGEPAPQPGGSSESMVIPLSSLPAGCRVWFAVRTTDDAANESELSNGASVDTPAGG